MDINFIGKVMDLMDKYEWLTANIATYVLKNNIDYEPIFNEV